MKKILAILLVLVVTISLFTTVSAQKKSSIAAIVSGSAAKTIIDGMKAAAEKMGLELLISEANDPSKELIALNNYIVKDVDAIIIAVSDDKSSSRLIKIANDNDVKTVFIDYAANAVFTVADQTGQTALGKICGKAADTYIKSALTGKPDIKVAVLKSALAGSGPCVSSFLAQIKGNPGVKVVSQQTAWSIDMVLQKTGDILMANPDLDIAFGYTDDATKGWVMAAQNSRKRPAVFGIDTSSKNARALDNVLQAVYLQDRFQDGYMSIVLAAIDLNR